MSDTILHEINGAPRWSNASDFLTVANGVSGPAGEAWSLSYYTASIDLASIAAHTAASHTHNATGGTCAVGDIAIFIGRAAAGAVNVYCDPVVATTDQIILRLFNADTGATDTVSQAFHFLIIHT